MEADLNSTQVLIFTLIGIIVMLSMAIAFIMYHQTLNKRLFSSEKKQKELKIKHQRELLQSNIRVQEGERKTIAQDLHDDIGANLNIMNIYIHQIILDSNEKAIKGIATDLTKLLSKTIQKTRNISHRLIPPTLEKFGLISAIQELAIEINNTNNTKLNLILSDLEDLHFEDFNAELSLFRVFQELISNTIKHSKSDIEIIIKKDKNILIAIYKDKGQGFNVNTLNDSKGIGHKNIVQRIEMIRGSIENLTKEGKGAYYQIRYKLYE